MGKKLVVVLAGIAVLIGIAWLANSTGPDPAAKDAGALEKNSGRDADLSTDEATLVSARPVVSAIDGYTGSDSCMECHKEYHQSWHQSFHRTMTQPITPETAPQAIQGGRVTVQGETYKFSRRNDEFFVELNDPIANGNRKKRRLVLMTGSHHAHLFWYESGYDKTPAQLQIMYVIEQQRWVPRRSFFLRPPSMEKENELGRWNKICSNCHATHPRQNPDANKIVWDTQVSEFGISCEACHGPGEAHVAYHQPDAMFAEGSADPIINPLDLPNEKRSDLCGQCHGMMMASFEDAADEAAFYAEGRRFRPGDDLEDAHFLKVVRASEEFQDSEVFRKFDSHPGVMEGHFWPDGEMRVTGRDYTSMIESKCFEGGELSCMSCHTMHELDTDRQMEWRDDQLLPGMRSDTACLQCHPQYKELGTQHTHHPIESEGSRCMNCHMPHTIYGILKTSRSHTITSPSVAKTIETGRPNACNLCHLDHTLQQTSQQLADWYGHEIPKLTAEQKRTAASVLHFLTGDAAQRVLQVNAFQWPPAQEASGSDWLRLYLLLGMEDSYDAIRIISERGYKSLPDASQLDYDFLDSPEDRGAVLGPEYQEIMSRKHDPNEALLIDSDGYLDRRRLESLMNRRNHRPVYLQE